MTQADPAPRDKPARPRRCWFQFSLRTLLILTTTVAIWIAWWSHKARQQRQAVAALRAAGALVTYDFENTGSQIQLNPPPKPERPRYRPAWLVDALGVDYFANVESVSHLTVYNISDSDLTHLEGLPALKYLTLWETHVTDAGLKHVKRLTVLESLNLRETHVTDAGLENLRTLTNLKYLWLENTHVTDAGVQRLKRALPKCKVIR